VKEACGASKLAAAAGRLKLQTSLQHKYLQSIDVEVTATFGGSDNEALLVRTLHASTATICAVGHRINATLLPCSGFAMKQSREL
jgi:hypothetical protein